VGKIGGPMEGLLSFHQLIDLDEARPQACPGVPVLGILLGNLFEHGDCFIATVLLREFEGGLDTSVCEVPGNGIVVWRKLMRDREDGGVVSPLGLLRKCERRKS